MDQRASVAGLTTLTLELAAQLPGHTNPALYTWLELAKHLKQMDKVEGITITRLSGFWLGKT